MSTYTKTMNPAQIEELEHRLKDCTKRKTPPYALYQYKTSDCVITAYASGKVVFQGEGADFYIDSLPSEKKSTPAASIKEQFPQCGSDEVGTGDYFGPVVVCAAYVKQEQVSWLKSLGIQDSKAMDDAYIRKIGNQVMSEIPHSLLILNNAKYNQIHSSHNMVAIKSKLHNQAYVHLQKKIGMLPSLCVVDQFVAENSYYRYLKNEKEVIKNLLFETKAENKYLSVACASLIARYAFLLSFDAMQQRYNFSFPKGAGKNVDISIQNFVEKYGKEELYNIAKLHFANTNKAKIM